MYYIKRISKKLEFISKFLLVLNLLKKKKKKRYFMQLAFSRIEICPLSAKDFVCYQVLNVSERTPESTNDTSYSAVCSELE